MVAAAETAQLPRKRRSRAEKVGRLKYIIELQHRILRQLSIMQTTQRYIIEGLDIGGYLQFHQPYIEKVCCKGEIDIAILDELFRAGEGGILPKDIALNLKEYGLDRWQVLRRIKRMNKRLEKEIAKKIAEKRGHRWALTNFAYKAWKQTYEELKE
jgi:hypothetical protein